MFDHLHRGITPKQHITLVTGLSMLMTTAVFVWLVKQYLQQAHQPVFDLFLPTVSQGIIAPYLKTHLVLMAFCLLPITDFYRNAHRLRSAVWLIGQMVWCFLPILTLMHFIPTFEFVIDCTALIVLELLCLALCFARFRLAKRARWVTPLFLCITVGLSFFTPLHELQQQWMPAKNRALSDTTQSLLTQLHAPLALTLYTDDPQKQAQFQYLMDAYQRIKPDITYTIKAHTLPKLHIQSPHHESTHLIDRTITESVLTQALFCFSQKGQAWVGFLQGHGEPSLYGQSRHDMTLFRIALENQGFLPREINLIERPLLPSNLRVLVLASPKSKLTLSEEKVILAYLANGGQLLYLTESDAYSVSILNDYLGIKKTKSVSPAATVISHYPVNPFVLKTQTIFPKAKSLVLDSPHFHTRPFLTLDNQRILGALLTSEDEKQRIIVIGDAQFLNNGTIQSGANLALGLNLIHWLNDQRTFVQPCATTYLFAWDFPLKFSA